MSDSVPVPAALAAEVEVQALDERARATGLMRDKARALEVRPDTIITLLQYAIESVSLVQATGDERRAMAVDLVRQAVIDAPISDEREKLLLDMVDEGIVGHIVDLVHSAASGQLDTGAAVGVAAACCESLGHRSLGNLARCFTCCCKPKVDLTRSRSTARPERPVQKLRKKPRWVAFPRPF